MGPLILSMMRLEDVLVFNSLISFVRDGGRRVPCVLGMPEDFARPGGPRVVVLFGEDSFFLAAATVLGPRPRARRFFSAKSNPVCDVR